MTVSLLGRLNEETAQRLQDLATEMGLSYVNERDHLAQCFRAALADGLGGTGYRPAEPGERKCDFPAHFPCVGDIDALLVPAAGAPVWVELKCGSDKWALADCGWDAIKSAVGLALGAAREAYLLAGAPTALWRKGILGAELFVAGAWRAEDVRSRFETATKSGETRGRPSSLRPSPPSESAQPRRSRSTGSPGNCVSRKCRSPTTTTGIRGRNS